MTAPEVAVIPVDVLLAAYRQGIFPMAHDDGELYWHEPDPRAVFDLYNLTPDRTTARILRSQRFAVTIDQAFEVVIRACADREETWIDPRIKASYVQLHTAGHAHSMEAWTGNELAGGIYGVAIGGAFFGESMFGANNAGKVAFHSLVDHLRKQGFMLFDTQYINAFTAGLGAKEIARADFLLALQHAIAQPVTFG